MKSFLKNAIFPIFLIFALASCGGGDSAEVDFTKSEALAVLSADAVSKVPTLNGSIDTALLDRLFEQPTSAVIAEFVDYSAPNDSLESKKIIYARTKANVTTAFSVTEYEVLTEYDSLLLSFIQLKSRRALVKLLNQSDIKMIYENKSNQTSQPGRL